MARHDARWKREPHDVRTPPAARKRTLRDAKLAATAAGLVPRNARPRKQRGDASTQRRQSEDLVVALPLAAMETDHWRACPSRGPTADGAAGQLLRICPEKLPGGMATERP